MYDSQQGRMPGSQPIRVTVALFAALTFSCIAHADSTSKDAYIHSRGGHWVLGTNKVEKTIRLQDGRLEMVSFRNKTNQREYVQGGGRSSEFSAVVDGKEVTGISGGWTLVREQARTLDQGELDMELAVSRGPVGPQPASSRSSAFQEEECRVSMSEAMPAAPPALLRRPATPSFPSLKVQGSPL